MNLLKRHLLFQFFFVSFYCAAFGQTLSPYQDLSGKWGYKNSSGETVIKPQYKRANKFQGEYAIVVQNDSTKVIDSSRGLYFPVLGAINTVNHLVVPIKYHYLQYMGNDQFVFGFRKRYLGEFLKGVLSTEGKQVLPPIYSNISFFQNRYFVAIEKDTVLGKINGMDYRGTTTFNGLYDINGLKIIPCKYFRIEWAAENVLIVDSVYLTDGGKYTNTNSALFNSKGEQLTGFDYMVIGKFIDGISKARIGNKFGFIYPTGKIAIPIDFDYCEEFSNGYALIKQGDKWGAINKDGKTILDPKYDYQEVKATLKERFDGR